MSFSYQGKVPIRYALDFFSERTVLEELGTRRIKPLTGLKVVCYYGCLPVRPPQLTCVRDYENPGHMERVMEILGAEPVPWSYKTDCCGASLVMTRTDIVRTIDGTTPFHGSGGRGGLYRDRLLDVSGQPRYPPGGSQEG